MATVAAVIASTHHPFYYRASTATGEDRPPFADEWAAKIEAFRETLTTSRPDVLVMVGSDHFHQLWLDNMPQFLIGKAPFYDANFYNEEREFGLPRMFVHGREDLSAYLLREGMDAGFDLAFSNELPIDHSITCPLITLRPQADLPIVPIYTNIFAPPLRRPKRLGATTSCFLPYSSHCSNAIMTSRWHSSVSSPHGSATGHCHIPTSQPSGPGITRRQLSW